MISMICEMRDIWMLWWHLFNHWDRQSVCYLCQSDKEFALISDCLCGSHNARRLTRLTAQPLTAVTKANARDDCRALSPDAWAPIRVCALYRCQLANNLSICLNRIFARLRRMWRTVIIESAIPTQTVECLTRLTRFNGFLLLALMETQLQWIWRSVRWRPKSAAMRTPSDS